MDLNEIPLLSMLRGRMGYLNQQQRLIAENVANADTPGYTPRDLKPFTVPASTNGALGQAVTQPGHMQSPHASTDPSVAFKPIDSKDSETRLDGNSVVLEEQMIKMGDARNSFDAAVSFYEKAMTLLQTAVKAPGASG
jgi:flagellar basal-body rod protein FlgB